jgi:hypothetical protein
MNAFCRFISNFPQVNQEFAYFTGKFLVHRIAENAGTKLVKDLRNALFQGETDETHFVVSYALAVDVGRKRLCCRKVPGRILGMVREQTRRMAGAPSAAGVGTL